MMFHRFDGNESREINEEYLAAKCRSFAIRRLLENQIALAAPGGVPRLPFYTLREKFETSAVISASVHPRSTCWYDICRIPNKISVWHGGRRVPNRDRRAALKLLN